MDLLLLLGRVLFGGFFLYNGVRHLLNIDQLTGYALSKGVIRARTAVIGSGVLILLGGAMVVLGIFPRLGLLFIAIFLVFVTPKMHPFWKAQDSHEHAVEKIQFLKNVALLGATLLMLSSIYSWPFSLLPSI